MLAIELIERKVGDVDTRIIPLENLSSEDLDYIVGLACNMTDVIYAQQGQTNRVRTRDAHLVSIDTVRVVEIKEAILLWTIIKGNCKARPHLDQICEWLNESKHTHKGDLMIREQEYHSIDDVDGPECLFGESLEDALSHTSGKCETVEADPAETQDFGDDMSDEDLMALFDTDCMDLLEDPCPLENTEKEVEAVLHDFFSPHIEGQQEILLIEEV